MVCRAPDMSFRIASPREVRFSSGGPRATTPLGCIGARCPPRVHLGSYTLTNKLSIPLRLIILASLSAHREESPRHLNHGRSHSELDGSYCHVRDKHRSISSGCLLTGSSSCMFCGRFEGGWTRASPRYCIRRDANLQQSCRVSTSATMSWLTLLCPSHLEPPGGAVLCRV
jgi:hypothetical protein